MSLETEAHAETVFDVITTAEQLKSSGDIFEVSAELKRRVLGLIDVNPVLLFMKGTPQKPRCKFSRQCVELLRKHDIHFNWFDILQDNDIRQGLKVLFSWPTFPQLYADGKLIGGLDVLEQLSETDELRSMLPAQNLSLSERLTELVNMAHVMLFMKGTPDEPQCGFSGQMVDLLNSLEIDCGAFDVLDDAAVREGLKQFSGCLTFPQLYCGGQFVGDLDTVAAMAEQGTLLQHLGAEHQPACDLS